MSADKSIKELNALLGKLKNGDHDQSVFDEIYKRCCGHVAFVCSKLCDNKEDIEEIVQDTFMAAFKKAKDLRGNTFLALLRKIAARRCYDIHRSKKSQAEQITYLDEVANPTDLDENFLPEEYLQNKESRAEILKIINDLPPQQRKMIYLYYYAGISAVEIARLNNCSAVNVRKILYTAKNTIKSKLEGRTMRKRPHMAGVTLSSVLLMEAEVFAVSYAAVKTVGILGAAGAAVAAYTTTTGVGIIAVVSSVVAVGVVSAALYFTLSPSIETYEPEEPVVAISAPVLVTDAQEIELPQIVEDVPDILDEPEYKEYEEYEEYETSPVYEPEALEPPEGITEQAPPVLDEEPEEPAEPEVIEEPTEAIVYEPEPEPYWPQPYEPEPYEPEPEPYEPEPEPYEPTPIDRTPEILQALATAATHEEVNRIIGYYNFSLLAQMRSFESEEFRFYVLDAGSGDILVGIAVYQNQWRMKFEHFDNGQMPLDRWDIFLWMEE